MGFIFLCFTFFILMVDVLNAKKINIQHKQCISLNISKELLQVLHTHEVLCARACLSCTQCSGPGRVHNSQVVCSRQSGFVEMFCHPFLSAYHRCPTELISIPSTSFLTLHVSSPSSVKYVFFPLSTRTDFSSAAGWEDSPEQQSLIPPVAATTEEHTIPVQSAAVNLGI